MNTKRLEAWQLRFGDRFWCMGQLWQHCGWYSAAYHIRGYCLQTGERRIIGNAMEVEIFSDKFIHGAGI